MKNKKTKSKSCGKSVGCKKSCKKSCSKEKPVIDYTVRVCEDDTTVSWLTTIYRKLFGPKT